jgi:hypothetical protein
VAGESRLAVRIELPSSRTRVSEGKMNTLLLAALGGAVLIPAAIADTVAPPVDM